ncbi:MAG: lipopolysaccharide biosynthesis protein [Candidatus Thiodiazotropha sp. (ex Lucinoma borealis)]|nr:lipopolysaccharide biosynthesis protein [Candidatus Thiodiazotropha sp. (ex Lucinoma borealis)]MCU7867940.1 lipopolysaccharide biosynthesis protein [Candidatus Thiodiazotropha sp. (ex Lucinoma borealis)]
MEDEELLGIGDYVAILKRRKKQLIIPALVILILSAGLAFGLPSVYRSEATILIEQQEIPTELVRSTVTSYAGERIQVISQRVMTTENLGKIIDSYGLYKDEQENTSITLLVEKLREEIQLEMISADVVDPRSGRPTTATIAFKLSFNSKHPRVAQKVTNELVSLYLDENLKRRAQSALETSSFLGAEAEKLNQQITELETLLATFKEQHLNNLPELQQLNIQLMERNERELSETNQQIRNLEERKIYLQSELAQMSPTSDLYNSSGNRVMGTEDRLKALQTEYVALSTRYTDDHPTLVKIIGEIKALKKELGINAGGISGIKQSDNPAYLQLETQLQAAESELASLKEMRIEVKEKIKDFESRLMQSPQVEREYRNLTRDYENALAKYQEVKAKQLEAELSESLERERKGERFSLIEPPQLPEKPDKPNRMAILFLGFVFSFAGGFGNVLVRESMDQTVYGSKGVIAITQAPPLAVIPYIECSEDHRKKTTNSKMTVFVLIAAVAVTIVSVHLFYKPLDVIFYIVLRKLGIELGA